MGHIGERGKTPVYVYLPSVATFTLDKKIIEGEGITPDIEVDFDEATFKATGRDTQLDRALQFLRTGH
jgi:C-terminal processing protease CtpA/Prc